MALTETALILLAAGRSKRFGPKDKLLSAFNARPLLDYPASLFNDADDFYRVAVIGVKDKDRERLLRRRNWNIVTNPTPEIGQGISISLAIEHVQKISHIKAAIIILGDMPNISEAYIKALISRAVSPAEAVMSCCGETLLPPAIFKRSTFIILSQLANDTGAKDIFHSLSNTAILPLSKSMGIDIDTQADIQTYGSIL